MRTWSIPVMFGRAGLSCAASGRQTRVAATKGRIRFICFLGVWHSTRFYLTNFVEAKAEALFEALVGGFVVSAAGEIIREAGHVGDLFVEIVGVLVAFAVAHVLHETGDGVAKVEGDGVGFGFLDVFEDSAVAGVEGV